MMKFLIADDHAIVRKGLIQLLREEFPAVEVTEVSNGNEALEEVRKKILDIILLDISMPGRNGIETLKQIRAEGFKVPILMPISRSGHERLSDRELQVLQRIASGKTVSEIADEISLSVNTISTYRARILEKLALQNNAELMRYAFDNGLV